MLHDTLSKFYVMFSLRSFGLAMINLFLPIFIFTIRSSLFDLVNFFFFEFLAILLFFPIAGKLSARIGTAHTMLFSSPFIISFFALLYFFNPVLIGLSAIGFLLGFGEAFFWMPFHEEFSFISKTKRVGREVGKYRVINIVAALLGPFIGGAIIALFGFHWVFLLTIILILIGQIPLLLSKDIKPKQKFHFRHIFKKRHFPYFFPFVGHGAIGIATSCLWPIFIFILFPDFVLIGAIAMVVNFISIFSTLYISKKCDSFGKEQLVKTGSVLFSLTVMLRAFTTTIIHAVTMWFFGGLTWALLDVPFESLVYQKSKHQNKPEFFVAREMSLDVGRFIVLAVVFLLATNISLALSTAILVGGILGLWYWLT